MSDRRSIAPRPGPKNESVGATAAANTRTGFSTDDPSLNVLLQPQATASASPTIRKKVTSACQGCQKRRVKCDGQQPCATCLRTKSECSYTPELDGRSIKRKYPEVQRDQDLLNDLLETIRYSEDEHVTQIISLIRSDASLEDVKACITKQLVDIRLAGKKRTPEFRQLQTSFNQLRSDSGERVQIPQRPDVLEIQRLAATPLHNVPASPWTTVTNDDDLVSNLISVWCAWDKGWYDWIDEELFVRDMQSGSLDSMFCSPFLVNALLAWACPYSDFKEARTTKGSISQLMLNFMAEAKQLLEGESGAGLCLTTLQGLLVLHADMAVSGQDQSGYRYMLQSISMANSLMASPAATKSNLNPQMAKELSESISRTCWGCFVNTSQTFNAILKPQIMNAPRRSRPEMSPAVRLWRPYPDHQNTGPIPSHRDELFEYGCDFAVMEAELSRLLFDASQRPPPTELEQRILSIDRRSQQRLAKLPAYLNPVPNACPSFFCIHARSLTLTLRMFLPLREAVEGSSPRVIEAARQRCLDTAIEVARIIKVYMSSWGSSNMGVSISQPCVLASSILMEEQGTSRYFEEITTLCICLRALSRRWPICMGMLRMIQLDARQKGWKLPPQTDKLFEEFEDIAWKEREMKRYITMYPIAESSKIPKLTGDEIDMGQFLEEMEMLELTESGGGDIDLV